MSLNELNCACLYVVATPIGNLADMVPRAVEILQRVDLIAAEDTRHSARLMQHFDIATPLVSYHDHSDLSKAQRLIDKIKQGQSVALISDAGTPVVSDPGYRLVHLARREGIRVSPIPGACAFVAALSASGLPSDRFAFEGFPPAKPQQRISYYKARESEARTLIFYESPHRIVASIRDMLQVFGPSREVFIARELTKKFETIVSSPLADVLQQVENDTSFTKGEIVVGVAPAPVIESVLDDPVIAMMEVLLEELPLKKAASMVAKITGVKKNKLYQWGIDRREV